MTIEAMVASGRHRLLNFLGFELCWFACVIGGAHGFPWLGPLLVVLFVAWHIGMATDRFSEWRFLLIGTFLGSIFDQCLLSAEWVSYPHSFLPDWLLPPWMIALWAVFCCTLNISMRWLRPYPFLAMVIATCGGPLSYFGGVKLHAMVWLRPDYVMPVLIIGWAILMPVLLKLSAIFDGYSEKS